MPKPTLKTRLLGHQLHSQAPFLGAALRRAAVLALGRAAADGDGEAARLLAEALAAPPVTQIQSLIRAQLAALSHPAAVDALWHFWRQTRHPELEALLLHAAREASEDSDYLTRLYSSLKLGREQFAGRASPSRLPLLLEACRDPDPVVAETALRSAAHLGNARTIKALCLAWVSERSPLLTGIMHAGGYTASEPPAVKLLTHLLQDPDRLEVDVEMIVPLIAALSDPQPEIARRAGYTIRRQLHLQPAIDKLCALWAEGRSPELAEILIQARYTASTPPGLRLLTLLKTGQIERAGATHPKGLPILLQAGEDPDPVIRTNARAALAALSRKDSREALCALAITDGQDLAREIATTAHYRPENPENCARFLFLMGDWEAYENLDFDQRLMRAIYETGSPELRQKIARQIQTAGRTSYLSILAGIDYRSPEASITPQESRILIQTLAEHREWERLWGLTRALALPEIVQIIQILAAQGWTPADEREAATFQKLVQLAQARLVVSPAELDSLLPAALPLAKLKVSGRVNAVAFAPEEPLLAIGVSARKAALWDFQHGKIDRLISGFEHSVGQVTFTDDGALVCAERTNNSSRCALYARRQGRLVRLGEHLGSITGLAAAGPAQVLSTGRDGRLVLWQTDDGSIAAETRLANSNWARGLTVSPNRKQAVLLYGGIQYAGLPGLQLSAAYSPLPIRIHSQDGRRAWESSMIRSAVFTPDESQLVVGYNTGRVVRCQGLPVRGRPYVYQDLCQASAPVSGLQYIPGHNVLVASWASGEMDFLTEGPRQTRRRSYSPIGRITSLHISPDGAFMATGSDEASLMLWDLRVYDIPDLFQQPLTGAHPGILPGVAALAQSPNLDPAVRNGLQILQILLEQRFQFDIQLAEIPQIQAGDYDIIIEDETHGLDQIPAAP